MASDDETGLAGESRATFAALRDRIKRHNAPIFAAAIAFFAFLALIPTLTGIIGIYGLIANADDVTEQLTDLLDGAPESTREFLVEQMRSIADSNSGALGLTVVISIAIALFSASGAMANLIKSLNVAYELDETRKPWVLRGLALVLMVGGVLVLCVVIFLMAALPPLLAETAMGDAGRIVLNLLRYPVLGVFMAGALSMLYRLGPDHRGNDRPLSPRLLTAGGVVATLVFVVLSALFSFYTANLGSYGETYGPLATIIVLLLWFQLSALAVILGAEVDAELSDRAWRERTGLEDPAAKVGDAVSAAEQLLAATQTGDIDGMLAAWHRTGSEHHPLFGVLTVPDQLRREYEGLFAAFPDLSVDVHECDGDDRSATMRYRLGGTFEGVPWHGVEPNGRVMEFDAVSFLSVEDGYIVRNDVLFDTATLVGQLGFRPGERSTGARMRRSLTNAATRVRRRVKGRGDGDGDDTPNEEATVTAA